MVNYSAGNMKKRELLDKLQFILIIILIISGLFIAYQIIRKILGGSWETENIIIALLMFNIGLTFSLTISHIKLNSDHQHLERQFYHLAKDFKEHISYKYKE